MKLAIIGSRTLQTEDIARYLPDNVVEIVSGGAKGIDNCAQRYAISNHLKLTEFLPDYRRYGRGAPLKRNEKIVEYADSVLIFWDGESNGTQFVIKECQKQQKEYLVVLCPQA